MRSRAALTQLIIAALFAPSAAAYQAQDDDVGVSSVATEVSALLVAKVPAPNERGRASARPAVVPLTSEVPSSDVAGIPAGLLDPLFGKFQIGTRGQFDFVIWRASSESRQRDRLLLDANGNRRLDDDPLPVAGVTIHDERRGLDYTEFTSITVSLRYDREAISPFTFTFYYWSTADGSPKEILALSRSLREGDLVVEGIPCRIFVYDENNDGAYQLESVTWRLETAEESAKSPPWSREFLPAEGPFKIKDVPYVMRDVSSDGSRVDLASLTEAQFDIADREVHPLMVEPERAKTAAPIEWMTDLGAALERAKKESRRVLLLAQVEWNESARNFSERTLSDAQVAKQMKPYVCVKVDLDRAPDLRKRFEIDGSPTVLILDMNGAVQDRLVGYRPARDFCEELLRNH